jgi:hypothetical protein
MDIETPLSIVKEVIEMDPTIAKAQQVVDAVSQNDAMLHAYNMYKLALYDEAADRAFERREGRKEGQSTVLELMEKGYTAQQIKEILASQV